MAKIQSLSLNPTKISGACGRLMCCLRYESPVYEELIKLTPKVGSTVILPGELPVRAYVMEVNLVTGIFLGQLEFHRKIRFFHTQQERGKRFTHLEIKRTVLDLEDHVVTEAAV